jgi:hypothetical protein
LWRYLPRRLLRFIPIKCINWHNIFIIFKKKE